MKPQRIHGFSSVTFIGIVAIAVVVIGGVALLQGSSDRSLVETQTGPSIIQNIAENKTESVTQAAADRTAQIEEQLNIADTQSEPVTVSDSTPAEAPEVEPITEDPAPDVVTPEPAAEPEPEPVIAATPGTFTDYSVDKLTNGTNVLFFHAQWCPSCRGLEDNLNANLANIPENVHILKLDYDSETELKKQYGVIRQHTLVVVDANGKEVKKLTGLTNTLDQVVSQL